MSFRFRISLVFTLLVGCILALFGTYLYFHSERLREREFEERLRERTELALRFVQQAERMPDEERMKIENTLLTSLPDEWLVIYDVHDSAIFARSASANEVPSSWLKEARRTGAFSIGIGERQYRLVRSNGPMPADEMVALASAVDRSGKESLFELRRALFIGSALMMLLTALIGWVYATWALVPVRHVVRIAAEIREPSERLPVPASHRKDELGEIATTFNAMLGRLQDAFEMQRSFIAGASHELRTPLTIIRGEVQQALQLVSTDPELTEKLLVIQDQAVEIQDLLSQLLWLARTRSGSGEMPMEPVRMDELADRAMERCRMRYPDRPVSLSMSASNEDLEPLVNGNGVLLTAALYNLLSNAAKYGGSGPIRVSIDTSDKYVWVCVGDDGPGMPSDVVERAREMFFRAQDVLPLDGHGIGLALVERIAKAHKGKLEITTAPGQGTKACIRLRSAR